jgi:Holliday junction resolvase RusA-like endonuclease
MIWMMMPLKVTLPFQAKPQGSKNAFTLPNGRVVLVESARNLKPLRAVASAIIADQAKQQQWTKSIGSIDIRIIFVMDRPKTVTRRHHTVKPDIDKMVRFTLDAITDAKTVWKDDSQVTHLTAKKRYINAYDQQPRVEIAIWEQNAEAAGN